MNSRPAADSRRPSGPARQGGWTDQREGSPGQALPRQLNTASPREITPLGGAPLRDVTVGSLALSRAWRTLPRCRDRLRSPSASWSLTSGLRSLDAHPRNPVRNNGRHHARPITNNPASPRCYTSTIPRPLARQQQPPRATFWAAPAPDRWTVGKLPSNTRKTTIVDV